MGIFQSDNQPNYNRVRTSESVDDEGEKIEVSQQHVIEDNKVRKLIFSVYISALHFIVVLLVGGTLVRMRSEAKYDQGLLLKSEIPFASPYVQYTERTFDPSGFADTEKDYSRYFGPPSTRRDQLWSELYDVGMLVITEEEAQRLEIKTAKDLNQPSHRLVTVEVFHQLHCLDYIRHSSYAVTMGGQHHASESEWSRTRHLDHCIDYLRQVLMCHGDLTPITLEVIPGREPLPFPNPPPYRPNFEIRHTCRDFDKVYEFALQRNTSGYKVA